MTKSVVNRPSRRTDAAKSGDPSQGRRPSRPPRMKTGKTPRMYRGTLIGQFRVKNETSVRRV